MQETMDKNHLSKYFDKCFGNLQYNQNEGKLSIEAFFNKALRWEMKLEK